MAFQDAARRLRRPGLPAGEAPEANGLVPAHRRRRRPVRAGRDAQRRPGVPAREESLLTGLRVVGADAAVGGLVAGDEDRPALSAEVEEGPRPAGG